MSTNDGSACRIPRTDVVFDDTHGRAEEIIARYPEPRSALLPLLHLVQSVEGFVSQAGIDVLRAEARPDRRRGLRGGHVLHDVQAHAVRRAPGQRLHQHAVRGARRRRHLRDAVRATSGSGTRRPPGEPGAAGLDHPGARRVPGRLRPRPRCCRSTTSTTTTRPPTRALDLVDALQARRTPAPTRGAPLTDFRAVELRDRRDLRPICHRGRASTRPSVGCRDAARGPRLAEPDRRHGPRPAMPDEPAGPFPAAAGEEVADHVRA